MSVEFTKLLERYKAQRIKHPTVILGQFERVGSTFYLDKLEKTHIVHNEPYKQLIPHHWPISRAYRGRLESIDSFLLDSSVDAVSKLWLKNFALSKYKPGEQVIKETNLYFALPQFLSLFPYRKLMLLSRHPLGIIGSFRRNNLFPAWSYDDVVNSLKIQVASFSKVERAQFAPFLEIEGEWEDQLMWLIGLNAVILSKSLANDRPKIIKYDDLIATADKNLSLERDESSIFNTRFRKLYDDFERRFSDEEIEHLQNVAKKCSNYIQENFDTSETLLVDTLYNSYFLIPFERKSKQNKHNIITDPVPYSLRQVSGYKKPSSERNFVRLIKGSPIEWSIGLVTNREMGVFVQELLEAGLSDKLLHLFIRHNMPPERGGKIIFDGLTKSIKLTAKFSDYPAYWVTWIGAACYAVYRGLGLPRAASWLEVYNHYDLASSNIANHSYRHDEVVHTGRLLPNGVPDDFFGNLKIWCSDWADDSCQSKSLAGISWKHYFHPSYKTTLSEPFMANSRTIGLRLVRCTLCKAAKPMSAKEILANFEKAQARLGSSPGSTLLDVAKANEYLCNALIKNSFCQHIENV